MSPAAGVVGARFAFKARQAKSTSGPAYGGAAGRSARVSAQPHSRKRVLRIAFGDGLAAALDREPRGLRAPCGAVAGQAPPPGGRTDRPTTTSYREISMTVTDTIPTAGTTVDPDALACAGCSEPVRCEPPVGWPVRAGAAPLFSHRDGSVLCPDERGRLGEPIEVRP